VSLLERLLRPLIEPIIVDILTDLANQLDQGMTDWDDHLQDAGLHDCKPRKRPVLHI
jgi:hypothetical protein